MKLTQIKGNTWIIEADELIPLYKLDDHRVILLDDGLVEERDALEKTLDDHELTPVGVLCSHAHVDHCANSGYLQEKYGAKIALTAPEAGMCSSLLTLKCYFLTLPASEVERCSSCMIHKPDVIIPEGDGAFSFLGARFRILQTPGHSAGHICTITPDNVCYVADAALSWEFLNAKLPYNLSHQVALESREKLRGLDVDQFILAHRGICGSDEMDELIDANARLLERRAEDILAIVDEPMTASQINQAVCRLYQLFTKRPNHALRFERNIRFLTEFLVDRGQLTAFCRQGVVYYRRTEE